MISFDSAGDVTRAQALQALRVAFAEAGVDNPALDARVLVRAASGLAAEDMIRDPERALSAADLARLTPMAARRIGREPVSRIVQSREFWGLPMRISSAALDPRPDTEILVEAALAAFASRREEPLLILDLGVGSGAVLCALLSELPNAFGVGLEISPDAAALARSNLSTLGFAKRSSIVVGDWAAALDGHFDIVISNPPYIASAEIEGLAPEVRRHDPIVALDGGPDGLEAYRAIAAALGRLVEPKGGAFFLEMGAGQADGVIAILAQAGMGGLNLRQDLAGNDRVAHGRLLITGELTLFEDATWREPKKRLVLSSESSSPRSPSESRAAVGLAGACKAPAPSNA